MTVTTANPDPRSDMTLSNDGKRTPPPTAMMARRTRTEGRRIFFRFSHRLCSTSSGSRYLGSDSLRVSGPGSETVDSEGAGELGRVTYRGVGTEFGMYSAG